MVRKTKEMERREKISASMKASWKARHEAAGKSGRTRLKKLAGKNAATAPRTSRANAARQT